MTVTEVARSLGVSTMTIYRRLDKAGLNIAELRDKDTKELSAEGVSVIGQLFADTGATTSATQTDNRSATQPQRVVAQSAEVELAVLRVRLETMTETIERLTEERDRLREENGKLLDMLRAEQMTRQKLLSDGNQQRRGWFWWVRRRGGDGER